MRTSVLIIALVIQIVFSPGADGGRKTGKKSSPPLNPIKPKPNPKPDTTRPAEKGISSQDITGTLGKRRIDDAGPLANKRKPSDGHIDDADIQLDISQVVQNLESNPIPPPSDPFIRNQNLDTETNNALQRNSKTQVLGQVPDAGIVLDHGVIPQKKNEIQYPSNHMVAPSRSKGWQDWNLGGTKIKVGDLRDVDLEGMEKKTLVCVGKRQSDNVVLYNVVGDATKERLSVKEWTTRWRKQLSEQQTSSLNQAVRVPAASTLEIGQKYDRYLKKSIAKNFEFTILRHSTSNGRSSADRNYFHLLADTFDETKNAWKFKVKENPSEKLNVLPMVLRRLRGADPTAIKGLKSVYELQSRESDNRFYEKDLETDNEDDKWVAIGETRLIRNAVLKLEKSADGDLFWRGCDKKLKTWIEWVEYKSQNLARQKELYRERKLKEKQETDNTPEENVVNPGTSVDTSNQIPIEEKYDRFLKKKIAKGFKIEIPQKTVYEFGKAIGKFVLVADHYSDFKEAWAFRAEGRALSEDLTLPSMLTRIEYFGADPEAVKKLVDVYEIKPRERDNKYYEASLEAEDEEMKYVKQNDVRIYKGRALKFEGYKNGDLFWSTTNVDAKVLDTRRLGSWIKRDQSLDAAFEQRNGRPRVIVEIRKSPLDDSVLQYLETDDEAVSRGLGGWISVGERITVASEGLELQVIRLSQSRERVMYKRKAGPTTLFQPASFSNFMHCIQYERDFKARTNWYGGTRKPNELYNVIRPNGITNKMYRTLQEGPSPSDGYKYVYILHLDPQSIEYKTDNFKIGTSCDMNQRLNSLARGNAGIKHILAYKVETPYGFLSEHLAHVMLEEQGHSKTPRFGDGGTEWFDVTLAEAKQIVDQAVLLSKKTAEQGKYHPPKFSRQDLLSRDGVIVDDEEE